MANFTLICRKWPTPTPQLSSTIPTNVADFLEYVRLNYAINPMCLVEEESHFKQDVLNSNAKTLIDRELSLCRP